MRQTFRRVVVWFYCGLLLTVHMCCAADWMRGAVCVKDVEGEVRLELMGGGPIESEVSVVGQFFPGVVRLSAVQGGAFFVRASNQLAFSFAGPGSCGVERFEQQVIGAGLGDDGLSRMILNINDCLLYTSPSPRDS